MNAAKPLLCAFLLLIFFSSSSALWPWPSQYRSTNETVGIATTLKLTTNVGGADPARHILEKAWKRYQPYIFHGTSTSERPHASAVFENTITDLQVTLSDTQLNKINWKVDESYNLTISAPSVVIMASNVFGFLRAIETFSQLVGFDGENYYAAVATISDTPNYDWRGLLIDTSRHYLPVSFILHIIESMPFSKLNVLHWHMVDGQSFPFQSQAYPLLWQKGAYNPDYVYTFDDITLIVETANEHGVRVVPEFDVPGHSTSWGYGYPWLIMNCSQLLCTGQPAFSDPCGDSVMDPTNDNTYTLVSGVYAELAKLFGDDFMHMGGDEVVYECWNMSARVTEWMAAHGIASGDFVALEQYFWDNVIPVTVGQQGRNLIIWEDPVDNGVTMPAGTTIDVWRSFDELNSVVTSGYYGILSYGWYLDALGNDWSVFYGQYPNNGNLSSEAAARILGGEASMWGESVDANNFDQTVWPRASAMAERLWSAEDVVNRDDTIERLELLICVLSRRGVGTAPIWPGWCYFEY